MITHDRDLIGNDQRLRSDMPNSVGKRFNAFGSWTDGQAIGWRVEATAAATAYTPASISKWHWKSVLPTNLP